MAKTINPDLCIQCEACVVECPNEGISMADDVMVIDPTKCTECAGMFETSQCAANCPVDAVEDAYPREEMEVLLSRAADLHPERFPRD
ncbi:MAG TPA: 4Fe-4S binding protein [Armatimonadota bacterium]|jgi:ferredoxin